MPVLPAARFGASIVLALLALAAPAAGVEDVQAPLADEAVNAFAKAHEGAVSRRDVAEINRSFLVDRLLERAFDGIEVSADVRSGFCAGVRDGFDWGRSLSDALGEDGHYRLLRVRRVAGAPRALYRMVNSEGALNYHDLHLARGDDGAVVVVDAYVFLTGENLSVTLRRSLDEALDHPQGDWKALAEGIGSMGRRLRSGDAEGALEIYASLPETTRRNKTIMVMRVAAAAEVGAEATRAACADFRRWYPDDPCVDLVTFDDLVLQSQWDEALAALKRIGMLVGEDAYLDDLAASVHIEAGRGDQARRLARGAVEKEPTLEAPYWTLLGLALNEADHPAAARWLTALEERFGYTFNDLTDLSAYADFVKSDAYRTWVRGRAEVANAEQ